MILARKRENGKCRESKRERERESDVCGANKIFCLLGKSIPFSMFISLQSVYFFLCSFARSFNRWFIVFHAALCVLQLKTIIYAFLAVRFYLQTNWVLFFYPYSHTYTLIHVSKRNGGIFFFDSKEISRLDFGVCGVLMAGFVNIK